MAEVEDWICVVCVTTVPVADLYVDENGDKWDVCTRCGEELNDE